MVDHVTELRVMTVCTYHYSAMQALSKALLDLRADMVSQAQSEVLANAEQAANEINVQRLVDKRTKELQVCYSMQSSVPASNCVSCYLELLALCALLTACFIN